MAKQQQPFPYLPLDEKPKPRFARWVRNTTALSAAVGVALGAPYALDATASHNPAPLPDCAPYSAAAPLESTLPQAETNAAVAQKLLTQPESADAIILNSALNNMGDLTKMWLISQASPIEAVDAPRDEAKAYDESCALREPLRDLRIFNPSLYNPATYVQMKDDPANYLTFQNIAHFKDADSGHIMQAFYEPQTGILSLQSVGLWHEEESTRVLAAVTENTDTLIPYEFTEKFLTEVREQVRSRGLEVTGTSIFAHSMGAAGGLLLKAQIEQGRANQLVFGKTPNLTIVEGFNESLAAQTIAARYALPMEKLTRNTISARSGGEGTANFIAAEWETNHPVGQQVYAISTDGGETHALSDIMAGLLKGTRSITPYEGRFSASGIESVAVDMGQFLGKLAKAGRDAREGLGIG